MVLDLLTLTAIPTAVGASEAVHQQRLLDEEAESEERQAPFYLDVYCDAKSSRRDEVHDAIVVLKDGKVCNPLSGASLLLLTNRVNIATALAQRPEHATSKEKTQRRNRPTSFLWLLPTFPD